MNRTYIYNKLNVVSNKAPIGYIPVGGGGINNQKMALIGLFLTAFQNGMSVSLPDITIMDQINRRYDRLPFHNVFSTEGFYKTAERFSIPIVQTKSQFPHGYDKYFWKTHNFIASSVARGEKTDEVDLVLSLLDSFSSRLSDSQILQDLAGEIYSTLGVTVAAQFRIEQDWERHCRTNSSLQSANEQNYLSAEDIVKKIISLIPDIKRMFVTCDEPALPSPKEIIKKTILDRYGIDLLFKSDYLTEGNLEKFNATERSLIDFDLGVKANLFVGTSRSTFSNLIALQSFAARRRIIVNQFIYNTSGVSITQRRDNGCYADATRAIKGDSLETVGTTWRAKQESFLKRVERPSWELGIEDKIHVKTGDLFEGLEVESKGGHRFFDPSSLNGKELDHGPWGLVPLHWGQLS